MPEPEGPGRLVKQLMLLAKGLALVRDTAAIDEPVYEIVKKVAGDTIPQLRLKVLRTLWDLYREKRREWRSSKDIADCAKIPLFTVKLQLEDLFLLEMADSQQIGTGDTATKIWRPSRRMKKLVTNSGVFT
jgi:hypothetical protein